MTNLKQDLPYQILEPEPYANAETTRCHTATRFVFLWSQSATIGFSNYWLHFEYPAILAPVIIRCVIFFNMTTINYAINKTRTIQASTMH